MDKGLSMKPMANYHWISTAVECDNSDTWNSFVMTWEGCGMRLSVSKMFEKTVEWINLSWHTTVNGRRLKIPILGGIGFCNLKINEPWMLDLLNRIVPSRTGVFVDVGVNLGQTLIMLRSIEPSTQYLGFEPNPVCVNYALRLIHLNGFENCKVVSAGISDSNGVAVLNCYDCVVDSSASMIEDFHPKSSIAFQFTAPIFSLDHVYEKLNMGRISIIKIDAEGSELEIIRGSTGLIRKYRPIIICEILPPYSSISRRTRQEELEGALTELKYVIYRIEKDKNKCLQQILRVDCLTVHSDECMKDYVFLPSESSVNLL